MSYIVALFLPGTVVGSFRQDCQVTNNGMGTYYYESSVDSLGLFLTSLIYNVN